MANPIVPIGRRLVVDDAFGIESRARSQDIERTIREDDEHFRLTGENRLRREPIGPLVDDDIRNDVANDGDSYDEQLQLFRRSHTASGDWAEDTPTAIINGANEANRTTNDIADDLRALHGVDINRVMSESLDGRPISREAREAYLRREQERMDVEAAALTENKRKYKNAISGLDMEGEI